MTIKFTPKPSEKKLESLGDLYYAIDFLIVSCPRDLNPMTDDGMNFWDWGVLKVCGVEIPAPYKDYGITASGRKVGLTDQQSAVTNTAIFLHRLLDLYCAEQSGHDLMSVVGPMGRYQLSPAFKFIDSLGVEEFQTVVRTLLRECQTDSAMCAIVD